MHSSFKLFLFCLSHLKGWSPPISRSSPQLPRLSGRILVPGQAEPPEELRLCALLRRVRPGPEPLAGRACAHRQHGELHQRRRWLGPGLQGAGGEHVHQPAGNHPSHGAAAEPGRGEL